MKKEELNQEMYKKIIDSSEMLLKREQGKSGSIIDAIDWLNEIAAGRNVKQISDIYIYEEGFGDTELALKNTILHAITSIISFEYRDEHLVYIENIVLADDSRKSEIALDYLLKIGRYHLKFQNQVLAFVERNLDFFSKNKLSTTGFYLVKLYHQDNRVTSLFQKIRALHDKKYRSQENKPQETEENLNKSDVIQTVEAFEKEIRETSENVDGSFLGRLKRVFKKNK